MRNSSGSGLRVVERRRRQRAADDRGGVEVEAALAQIGRTRALRGVAMHDEAAAIDLVAMAEERLAHPHHHLALLLVERHGQINAGMHEEAQPVVVAERESAQPFEMGILDAAMVRP